MNISQKMRIALVTVSIPALAGIVSATIGAWKAFHPDVVPSPVARTDPAPPPVPIIIRGIRESVLDTPAQMFKIFAGRSQAEVARIYARNYDGKLARWPLEYQDHRPKRDGIEVVFRDPDTPPTSNANYKVVALFDDKWSAAVNRLVPGTKYIVEGEIKGSTATKIRIWNAELIDDGRSRYEIPLQGPAPSSMPAVASTNVPLARADAPQR